MLANQRRLHLPLAVTGFVAFAVLLTACDAAITAPSPADLDAAGAIDVAAIDAPSDAVADIQDDSLIDTEIVADLISSDGLEGDETVNVDTVQIDTVPGEDTHEDSAVTDTSTTDGDGAADATSDTPSQVDASGDADAGGAACASDKECTATGQVCDPLLHMCVPCLTDAECKASEHCVGKVCEGYTACTNSLGCQSAQGPSGGNQPICDKAIGECAACVAAADCPVNNDCKGKACVPFKPCQNSTDCGTTQVCDKAAKRCVDCLGNADCAVNELCESGTCKGFLECASDKQCTAAGLLCDVAKNKCAQCLENTDCPGIYNCQKVGVDGTGVCVLDVCAQGQGSCQNNAKVTCNTVGDGYGAPQSCGSAGTCVPAGGKPVCQTWTCTPGVNCEGEKVVTCTDDGLEVQKTEDCAASGGKCVAGACKPVVCAAGTSVCDGNSVKLCAADGLSVVSSTPCGAAEYCDSGTCKPQVCAPNQKSCAGNTALTCNVMGNAFVDAGKDCGGSAVCVAGACVPYLCQPATQFCDGSTLKTCSPDGMKVAASTACPANNYCGPNKFGDAACLPVVCDPGKATCNGTTATTCKADGSGFDAAGVDCTTKSKVCSAGACVSLLCDPQTPLYCNGVDAMKCDATGLAPTKLQTCGAGFYCAAGACSAQICTPNSQATCAGNKPATCNADGSGYVGVQADCGAGKTCDAGVCLPQICTPNLPYCDAGKVKLCAADGLSSLISVACTDTEYCDTGSATCQTQICTPNAATCSGNKPATCNADGSGLATLGTDCGNGKTCDSGVCKAWLCEPSTVTCDAGAIDAATFCSDDGLTAWAATCPAGTYCAPYVGGHPCDSACGQKLPSGCFCDVDCMAKGDCCGFNGSAPDAQNPLIHCDGSTCGACNAGYTKTVGCETQVCVPGEAMCVGQTATVCDAKGSGAAAGGTDCSAAGQKCVGGVCQTQVCGNGIVEGTEACDAGSANGGPACTSNCAIACNPSGHAIHFDSAAANLPVGTSGFGLGQADFTFEAWLKHDSVSPSAGTIFNSNTAADQRLEIFVENGGVRPVFSQSAGYCASYFSPLALPTDLKWHHYAVVRSGSNWSVFLDGVQKASGSLSWYGCNCGATTTPCLKAGSSATFGGGAAAIGTSVGPARFSTAARYATAFTPALNWTVDGNTLAQWNVLTGLVGGVLADEAGGNNNGTGATGVTASAIGTNATGYCQMASVCTPNSPTCLGNLAGTCNSLGTGLVSVTDCGVSGATCNVGVCQTQVCGNGVVEGTEACDDGNLTGGDYCTASCEFSCPPTSALVKTGPALADTGPFAAAALGAQASVEYWVNFGNSVANGHMAVSTAWDDSSTGGWYCLATPTQIAWQGRYSDAASGLTQSVQLGLNVWHHIACEYDGANIRLFADGKLVGQKASTGPVDAYAQHLLLLHRNLWYTGSQAQYKVREIRIGNSAVYSADFQPASKLTATTGTVALFHASEGSGTQLANSIVGAPKLNVNGATTWASEQSLTCEICTPNTPTCLGNLAGTCNAQGTGLVSTTDCAASGKTCSAGVCK